MKDRSAATRSGGGRHLAGPQLADVDPLQHGDPRIGAQRPGELAVADVDGDDVRGAGPQQHVGEAAGGGAGVQAAAPGDAAGRAKAASAPASLRPPRETYRARPSAAR